MENQPESRYGLLSPGLAASVTPPRRRAMPVRNRTTARAIREPYTLRLSRPADGSREPPRGRCASTSSTVFKQSLVPNSDSVISADYTTTDVSNDIASLDLQSDTHTAEDSAIATSKKCQIKPRISVSSSQSAPTVPLVRQGESTNETTIPRPKQRGKSQSDPLIRSGPTSVSALSHLDMDKNIVHWLTKPLTNPQCQDQELGNNYIFETVIKENDEKRVVKIGCTKGPERTRLRTIRSVCKYFSIEKQDDPEHLPIRLYKRAEKLIQAELSDFQYLFTCQCDKETSHREYFDIDKTVALEALQRWREFCKREPYDKKEGKLRPFWQHRLKAMGLHGDLGVECDYEWRVKRWRKFLNPSIADSFWYDVDRAVETFKEDKWRVIAFFEALAVATLTYPNLYTSLFFAFIASWVVIEMMGFEEPITPAVFRWKKDDAKEADSSETSTRSRESKSINTKHPRIAVLDEDEHKNHDVDDDTNDAKSVLEQESLSGEEVETPDISLLEDAGSEVDEQEDE